MTSSPSSDKSLYFDAPIAAFHVMSLQSTTVPANETVVEAKVPATVEADKHSSTDEKVSGVATATIEGSEKTASTPSDVASGSSPATDSPPSPQEMGEKATNGAQLNGHSKSISYSPRRSSSLTRPSLFSNTDGQTVNGSAFSRGAATTGPNSQAAQNESLHQRAMSADASLTPKQRAKIAKAEAKDGQRLSKVIKQEAKAEKKALDSAITELSELQKVQKAAVKSEAKAQASHTKVLAEFQKLEAIFLAARTKFEASQARLRSEEEALEIVKNNAREATEKLQEKAQEVDNLRTNYGVDERERAAKLAEISAKSAEHKTSWFSR